MAEHLEVEVARMDERVSGLEDWRKTLNGLIEEIKKELQSLRLDWGNRPTWAVTIILTALSSLCVGLASYIIIGR